MAEQREIPGGERGRRGLEFRQHFTALLIKMAAGLVA